MLDEQANKLLNEKYFGKNNSDYRYLQNILDNKVDYKEDNEARKEMLRKNYGGIAFSSKWNEEEKAFHEEFQM